MHIINVNDQIEQNLLSSSLQCGFIKETKKRSNYNSKT